jgi:hypothetical protein
VKKEKLQSSRINNLMSMNENEKKFNLKKETLEKKL